MDFNSLFGGGLQGLLSSQDQDALKNQALMQAGLAVMAGSQGGQPGTGRAPLFPALLQGLQAGQQAYTSGAEGVLKAQDLKQKRESEARRKQLLGSLAVSSDATQQALAGGGGPTVANAEKMQQTQGSNLARMMDAYRQALLLDDGGKTAEQIKSMIEAEKPKLQKLGKGEQLIDEATGRIVAQGAEDLPTAIREYNFAVGQGFKGSFNDYQTQLKRAGASNTNVNVGGDNAFAKKGAELMATAFNDIAVQGKNAQRSLGQINQLDSLLQNTGGGIVPQAKMIAGNLGIPVEGLNDVQAATAIINQLVPAQRPAGSGAMSDRDVELFKQSVPRLINQPGGNKKILQTMREIAEYDRKMGQIASDALTGRISREDADMLMQRIPNPLSGFSGGGGTSKSTANPDALLKKYGIK